LPSGGAEVKTLGSVVQHEFSFDIEQCSDLDANFFIIPVAKLTSILRYAWNASFRGKVKEHVERELDIRIAREDA
jgi:hypothetical protein